MRTKFTFTPEEIKTFSSDRLFQYKISMQDIMQQRNNYYLLAESMLFLAYASINNKIMVSIIMVSFGLLITLIWYLANKRLSAVYKFLRDKYVIEFCPEYKDFRQNSPKTKLHSWELTYYFIPIVTGLAWIALLLYTLLSLLI